MSEQEMIAKVTERSKEMLANPEIEALYQSKATEAEAKDWLFHQALITLLYSPEERAAMAKKKLNQN